MAHMNPDAAHAAPLFLSFREAARRAGVSTRWLRGFVREHDAAHPADSPARIARQPKGPRTAVLLVRENLFAALGVSGGAAPAVHDETRPARTPARPRRAPAWEAELERRRLGLGR